MTMRNGAATRIFLAFGLMGAASVLHAPASLAGITGAAMAQQAQQPPAAAQTTPDPTDIEPTQVSLTGDMVESFLKSYPDLVELGKKLGKDKTNPDGDSTDSEEDPAYTLAMHLNNPAAAGQINDVLKKYSFGSYADWANVAHSIAIAAEAEDPDSGMNDLDEQKKQARADLEADDSMSTEEKQAALAELDQQFAALAEFVPLPGNREAVKPYLERIRKLSEGRE